MTNAPAAGIISQPVGEVAMRLVAAAVLLASFASPAAAEIGWLCLADSATGFAWDGQRWIQSNFYTDKKRYIISQAERSTGFVMKKVGEPYEQKCTAANEYGFIACDMIFGQFIFNSAHLRYLMTYPVGFIDGKDNQDNTPSIEIGSCSPL
jgi:hypothetical protein